MTPTTDHTVLVLSGGLSHEREVSLRSGRRVATALRDSGYTVLESDVDQALVPLLQGRDDIVVVPLLHGETGEDGAIREVLELVGAPYVGSRPAPCRLAFDKSISTAVMAKNGVTTPHQVALPHDIFRELGANALVSALGGALGFPMMVKPARSGSALGCTKVSTPEELPAAMVGAYAYGPVAVVETYIEGVEVAVGVLDTGDGPRALPAVEIRPQSGVYDYAARYTAGATRFLTPAQIDDSVAAACAEMALRVHERLGLRDLSRTDLIIRDGEPVFIEANVAPGMTETSLLPIALEAEGGSLAESWSALVEHAVSRMSK
ncbi:D-alanine--D-alanine ligase family protein [Granulicoccus phenolivorans]|uniref:D-alanine--D-alanine ligase family protein n=1 Tax=Granulicoccus phenolivorans TaxID=266854 RepID=UPI000429989C|nr:D-alanine--D-alanine ligase [Granulicoccus phenolivorans]